GLDVQSISMSGQEPDQLIGPPRMPFDHKGGKILEHSTGIEIAQNIVLTSFTINFGQQPVSVATGDDGRERCAGALDRDEDRMSRRARPAAPLTHSSQRHAAAQSGVIIDRKGGGICAQPSLAETYFLGKGEVELQ